MPFKFQHIGVIAKPHDPRLKKTLQLLYGFLISTRLKVYTDPNSAGMLDTDPSTCGQMAKHCELVIVVGGDGTFLHAAREMIQHEIPLVGVNLGRLGFLVDISPDQMEESLNSILRGEYVEDRRFLLQANIGGDREMLALNDVVLHKWNIARMIEFETSINGQFVDSQRSDGIIISTPTGSTAYALSGGGPLLEPGLDAIVLVPICPHRLSNRPIVVHGNSEITIDTCGRTDSSHVRVTCDGQASEQLNPGDKLVIRKYSKSIRLFHPQNHDHFNLLRAKLGWGGHLK